MSQKINRQYFLEEGKKIFADSANYSDDEIIAYTRIVSTVFGKQLTPGNESFTPQSMIICNLISAINTLQPNEKAVILYGFGAVDKPLSNKELGELLHLSTEQIRQIMVKALRRLRNPYLTNRFIVNAFPKKQIQQQELQEGLEKLTTLGFGELGIAGVKILNEYADSEIPIADLGFTVATFNCFMRAHCKTVDDFLRLTDEQLLEIKHMGVKRREEAISKKAKIIELKELICIFKSV